MNNYELLLECVTNIFNALPKNKQMDFLGEYNDLCLFFEGEIRISKTGEKKDVQESKE